MNRILLTLVMNLIFLTSVVLSYRNYREDTKNLVSDFNHQTLSLEQLQGEYYDSTRSVARYFSSKEVTEYVKKIEDDSLRDFILTQRQQLQYFSGYQSGMENQLKTMQFEIEDREKYSLQFFLICLSGLIVNLVFLGAQWVPLRKGKK